jgi:hypothetical protein
MNNHGSTETETHAMSFFNSLSKAATFFAFAPQSSSVVGSDDSLTMLTLQPVAVGVTDTRIFSPHDLTLTPLLAKTIPC